MNNFMLFVGAVLFGIGMLGFLTRRNLILIFLSLEMMLAGVSLNFITFSKQYGDLGGQVFVLLILSVAACEAALALALIVALFRSRRSLDVNVWQSLRESTMSNVERSELMAGELADAEASTSYGDLPKLTPAGRDPLQHPSEMEIASRDLINKA